MRKPTPKITRQLLSIAAKHTVATPVLAGLVMISVVLAMWYLHIDELVLIVWVLLTLLIAYLIYLNNSQQLSLLESEANLEEAQRIAKIGSWKLDLTTGELQWSDQIFEMFDIKQEAFDGTTKLFYERVHRDDRKFVLKTVNKAIRDRENYAIDHRIVLPNGAQLFVHEQGVVNFGDDGEPLYMIGTVQDITERKQVEENLHISENRLVDALDSISEGFVLYDPDGRLIICNSRYKEFYGYSDDEAATGTHTINLGRLDIERGNVVVAEGQVEEYLNRRENLEVGPPASFIIEMRDGRTLSLRDRKTVNGGIVSTQTDITERNQAEKTLQTALIDAEQANQAKSEFLATMSHEFRTPLNAILGFSEMMRAQYFGPLGAENYKEYAKDIHGSGEHMLALVNDMLDVAAIEAGKRTFIKEVVDVGQVLRGCINDLEYAAKNGGVDLTLEVPDDFSSLFADRRSIVQIVLNLLSNAIKFTEPDGSVVVSVSTSDHEITIKVRDTGIGIASDRLPLITQPFSQTHDNSYISQKGTGLGLSIVKSLVEIQEGKLNIESEIDKGTTITVVFPVHSTETEEPSVK